MSDGSVVVVEIITGRLTGVGPDRTVSPLADVGGGPNGAATGPDGALYVCNNGGVTRRTRTKPAIQRVDPDSGQVDTLYAACDGQPLKAPNDLVFDRTGGFWFTDYAGSAIYYARADGSAINRVVADANCPNGIGLSPGDDVLYWSQTVTRQVHRRRLTAPGEVVTTPNYNIGSLMHGQTVDPWTLVIGLPGAEELDSLAVEAEGRVCVGTLVDGGITVVSPEDGSSEKYTLPEALMEPAVTNICFGGPDLRTAYITLSLTGRLVSCRWPRAGLRLAYQDVQSQDRGK